MRKTAVFAALLLCVAAFAGAALAQPASAALAETTTADVEKSVANLLVQKLGDDAKPIKVAVVKGKVVLTGEVTSRATAELATEVALAVAGVKDVDNQVQAAKDKAIGEGKIKDEAADSKVEMAVESALKKEIGQHEKGLSVEVTAGVVSIRGPVPDQARKDLALKTAKGVEGVKKVVDLISIGK